MVTYYAVNAGGTWNTGATWSTISAKNATRVGGAVAPTSADTCILDDYSGNVTLNAGSVCLNIDENGNGAYGGTLAFGTQTLTVSGDATLRGAMTNTSGTIVVVGNITLAATPTGTFPLLTLTPTADNTLMTGATFTWGGALKFNAAKIIKLSGSWINTGLVTYSAATNLNYNSSSAETLTCNGGLTMSTSSGTTPTATIVLGGGIWSANSSNLYNNLTFNGNSTVSGAVLYLTGTITYTSGTITTTGSTLTLASACTLTTRLVPDTGGITWDTISASYASATITLGSNLKATTMTSMSGTTFSGAYNISTATLRVNPTVARTITLVAGQTLTITGNLYIDGNDNYIVKLQNASATTYLNYTGTLANQKVFSTTFTYINASGATWVTSHAYAVGDLVNTGGSKYLCAIAHTSGTFATDLASGDWTIQNTKQIYNYCGGVLSNTVGIINASIGGNTTGQISLATTGVWGAGTVASNGSGRSGNCVLLTPSSTDDAQLWTFLVPTTAFTAFTLAFWHKISSTFNGTLTTTIYDTDDTTLLLNADNVAFTDDGAFHQYTASLAVTPTSTGFCRVVLSLLKGTTGTTVSIDDITAS